MVIAALNIGKRVPPFLDTGEKQLEGQVPPPSRIHHTHQMLKWNVCTWRVAVSLDLGTGDTFANGYI